MPNSTLVNYQYFRYQPYMSEIDNKTVQKIAKLARIKLTDDEQSHFEQELNQVVDWFAMLGEVDTNNVEPLTSVADMSLPQREDKVTDGNKSEAILSNAPNSEFECFLVPKVIDQG